MSRARLPRNRSRTPPAIPPNVAASPAPANISTASLYCRSLRFCRASAATSCPASYPPVSAALRTFSPIVFTCSGPSLSTNLDSIGTSMLLTKRAIGSTSSKPIGAPRKVAALRTSSLTPASRARSLASPAAAPTPNAAAVPVATPVAAAAGARAARPAAGRAIPAIEPNAEPSPLVNDSGSPPSGENESATDLMRSRN